MTAVSHETLSIMRIEVRVRCGPSGLLMAHSPELPGLHAMERTMPNIQVALMLLVPVLLAERVR